MNNPKGVWTEIRGKKYFIPNRLYTFTFKSSRHLMGVSDVPLVERSRLYEIEDEKLFMLFAVKEGFEYMDHSLMTTTFLYG